MNYGKALRIIRAAKGLSQQQVAEKTGLSKSLLCRIESNNRNLSLKSKKIVADTLGVPLKLIDFLAIEKTEKTNGKIVEDIGRTLLLINDSSKKD